MDLRLQEQVNLNIEKTIASLTQAKQFMKSEWDKIRQEKEIIQQQQQNLREDRLRLDKERKTFKEEVENFHNQKKFVEDKNLKTMTQVKLNVGGEEVLTSRSTLLSIKGTMVEAMFSGRHKLHEDASGCYFIDRSLNYFRWVLMYLRSHKLQLPIERSERQRVLEEFDYFCIPIEDQMPHTDFLNKPYVNSQTLTSDAWVLSLKVVNNYIVSGYRDNSIKLWDIITGECKHVFYDDSEANGIEGVDLVDGGKTIVSGSKCLKVWDLDTHKCRYTINDDVLIGFKVFGNRIYSMWEDGGVRIHEIDSGTLVRKWTSVLGCWVACSDNDNRRIVTESVNDYQFLIWDIKTEICSHQMEGHREPVCFVKIDGKRAFSGSYDKTLRVWDVASGTCLNTLRGHNRSVCAVDVAGNVVVSGSVDKTVKIWNWERGECVVTLEGHQNTVSCVEIVGNMIVTGSWDNTIKIWNVDDSPRRRTK